MPIYDVYCEKCGNEYEVLQKVDDKCEKCKCGSWLKRKCNCASFRLIYNNKTDMCSWGDDGYSTSQYWSAVKEQREKGKDVKPVM